MLFRSLQQTVEAGHTEEVGHNLEVGHKEGDEEEEEDVKAQTTLLMRPTARLWQGRHWRLFKQTQTGLPGSAAILQLCTQQQPLTEGNCVSLKVRGALLWALQSNDKRVARLSV